MRKVAGSRMGSGAAMLHAWGAIGCGCQRLSIAVGVGAIDAAAARERCPRTLRRAMRATATRLRPETIPQCAFFAAACHS